jgi:hypothetical protein
MAKLLCTCGKVLRMNEGEEEHLHFISDRHLIEAGEDIAMIYGSFRKLLACPDCNRLYLFWGEDGNRVAEYVRVDPHKEE